MHFYTGRSLNHRGFVVKGFAKGFQIWHVFPVQGLLYYSWGFTDGWGKVGRGGLY
jgi:hypothetical protein